jgi:hypothetical protein
MLILLFLYIGYLNISYRTYNERTLSTASIVLVIGPQPKVVIPLLRIFMPMEELDLMDSFVMQIQITDNQMLLLM